MGLSLFVIVIKFYVIFINKLDNDYSLDGIVEYRGKGNLWVIEKSIIIVLSDPNNKTNKIIK